MKRKNTIPKTAVTCISLALLAIACSPVKEYQKSRLNDTEMTLGNRRVEKNEMSFQAYREGAAGANAGKTGGGCGCN